MHRCKHKNQRDANDDDDGEIVDDHDDDRDADDGNDDF